MGYYLIERKPVDLAFCEMLKAAAVIQFSLVFNETVRRVEILLKERRVVVMSSARRVSYPFDDLIQ